MAPNQIISLMLNTLKKLAKKFQGQVPEDSDLQNTGVIEVEQRKFQQEKNKYLSLQNILHFIL
jgi:hypothetical protein